MVLGRDVAERMWKDKSHMAGSLSKFEKSTYSFQTLLQGGGEAVFGKL